MEHANHVTLVGRIQFPASPRELPSGERLVQFRVAVERPVARAGERARVDVFDCVIHVDQQPELAEAAYRWRVNDSVMISGALRRRFYRAWSGQHSRIEVEVQHGSLLKEKKGEEVAP